MAVLEEVDHDILLVGMALELESRELDTRQEGRVAVTPCEISLGGVERRIGDTIEGETAIMDGTLQPLLVGSVNIAIPLGGETFRDGTGGIRNQKINYFQAIVDDVGDCSAAMTVNKAADFLGKSIPGRYEDHAGNIGTKVSAVLLQAPYLASSTGENIGTGHLGRQRRDREGREVQGAGWGKVTLSCSFRSCGYSCSH